MYIAFRFSDGLHPLDREAEYIDSQSHLFSLRGQNVDVYEELEEGNFRAEFLSQDIENPSVPGKYCHLDFPVLLLSYTFKYECDIYGRNPVRIGIAPDRISPLLVTSMNFAKALILHGCIGYETDWEGRPSVDLFSGGRISLFDKGIMLPFGNLKFDETIDFAKVSDYVDAVWLDKARFDCFGDSWLLSSKSNTWYPSEKNHRRAKEDFSWRMNALKKHSEAEQKEVHEALEKATDKWNKFLRRCIRNGTIMVSY